jgi:hypothetical protein
MKKQFLNLVFGLIILSSASAQPQTDTSSVNNDSINASILANYNQQLQQIEQQRLADSVKKAELEIELSSLKTTDNLKKEELQKQLKEISKQEENRLAQKKAKIDSLRSTAKGFPVLGFFNDTLFTIYNKSGSFSAKERA